MQLFPQYMSQTKLTGGPLPTRKHKTPLTKPSGEPYGIVQDTSDKFRPAQSCNFNDTKLYLDHTNFLGYYKPKIDHILKYGSEEKGS